MASLWLSCPAGVESTGGLETALAAASHPLLLSARCELSTGQLANRPAGRSDSAHFGEDAAPNADTQALDWRAGGR